MMNNKSSTARVFRSQAHFGAVLVLLGLMGGAIAIWVFVSNPFETSAVSALARQFIIDLGSGHLGGAAAVCDQLAVRDYADKIKGLGSLKDVDILSCHVNRWDWGGGDSADGNHSAEVHGIAIFDKGTKKFMIHEYRRGGVWQITSMYFEEPVPEWKRSKWNDLAELNKASGQPKEIAIATIGAILARPQQDDVLSEAYTALVRLGPAADSLLIAGLKSQQVDSRRAAATAFGLYSPPIDPSKKATTDKIVVALMKATEDTDPAVRGASFEALGRLVGGGAADGFVDRIIPAMVKALQDESVTEGMVSHFANPQVRIAACCALGKCGARGMSAIPALLEFVKPTQESVEMIFAAIEGLGGIGRPAQEAITAIERVPYGGGPIDVAKRRIQGMSSSPGGDIVMGAVADGNLEKIRTLVGTDPQKANSMEFGWAPLHLAAIEGRVDCVDLLLGVGAKINMEDWQGRTPLYYAVLWRRDDVAALLLGKGADPSAGNAAIEDLRVQEEGTRPSDSHGSPDGKTN